MEGLELRAATPADADAVAAYHYRCFTNTYASQLVAGALEAPDRTAMTQQFYEWFLPGGAFETEVAVLCGEPIGHVTVSGHNLVHLFVDPDHQNMGLGGDLLAHGEASIAAAGHSDAELHVRVENLAAIAFYEKAGWNATPRFIQTVEHGISYEERVLIKRLGQARDSGP